MVCLVYLVYMQITEYCKREAYLQMHCFVTLLTAKTTKLVIPGLPGLCGLHANHCAINILFSARIFSLINLNGLAGLTGIDGFQILNFDFF